MEGRRELPFGESKCSSSGLIWRSRSEISHRKLLPASENICHVDILRRRVDFRIVTRTFCEGDKRWKAALAFFCFLLKKRFFFKKKKKLYFEKAGKVKLMEGDLNPFNPCPNWGAGLFFFCIQYPLKVIGLFKSLLKIISVFKYHCSMQ
jgi:hypothetical protein